MSELPTPEVQFSWFTLEETYMVSAIAERALHEGIYRDPKDVEMDLSATHVHCPLDLKKLFSAPFADFAHDMAGIATNLNRTTGRLENFFDPRCSLPEVSHE